MPVLNGEEFLERVLDALRGQDLSIPWDFLAVDCGSTDRTLAIFDAYARNFPVPLRVHQIHGSEFNHGDTRNLLVALSSGELAVFLTDDAIPSGADWLRRIAANFEEVSVAACHVRNVPRPEVSELLKVTSARDPNYQAGKKRTRLTYELSPEDQDGPARRALYNYNDVASAVRRSIWERYPYPHCDFGEDVLLGRAVLEAGYTVVFEDGVSVQHSHEYDCEQLFERGRADARFNVEQLQYRCVEHEGDVASLVRRKTELDRRDLAARGLSQDALESELERGTRESTAFFSGMHAGSRSDRRFRGTGLNPTPFPSIEVHGLPEEARLALETRGWQISREGMGAEVLHVHIASDSDFAQVADGVDSGRPVLCTVTGPWARAHQMTRTLLGSAECEEQERLGLRPDALSFGARPSVAPFELMVLRGEGEVDALRGAGRNHAVSARKEALLNLEMRYRALASTLRDSRGHCPLDRRGDEAVRVDGDAAAIAGGGLLLQAQASAEWDIRGVPPGDYSLLVSLETLAEEPGVVTGGQVFVDGQIAGGVGPYLNGSDHERRHLRLALTLGSNCERLRLEARAAGGAGMILRVHRVRILNEQQAFGRRSVEERSLDLTGRDGVPDRRAAYEGCDALRVGPKRGRATWEVRGLPAGRYRLRIWLAFGDDERGVTQAGRIEFDGRLVSRFHRVSCPDGGGPRMLEASVNVPERGGRLTVINRTHALGLRGFARVQRVHWTPVAAAVGSRAAALPADAETVGSADTSPIS